jgi:hypothetical protein
MHDGTGGTVAETVGKVGGTGGSCRVVTTSSRRNIVTIPMYETGNATKIKIAHAKIPNILTNITAATRLQV